jgi:tripartite-type tricarboxylate transporter receptor subunit TctC
MQKGKAMKLRRRQFLQLGAAAIAATAGAPVAWGQAYPTRPARIIVGFPAGGGGDIVARLIAQWLSERLGQPFVVENRSGAASNIGTEAVVQAPPDGYTLLLATTANAVNATFYEHLNFDFIRDITPVAGIVDLPLVMAVNPTFPAKTVPQFIAHAKANAGMLNMASPGTATPPHVAGELFKMMTGVDMLHVPYRGDSPAIADLLGGQVNVFFGTLIGSMEYIRAGKLRALAVTTRERQEALPDVPPMGDFLPGFEASAWLGLGAPKNTSAAIVDKLNKEINAALLDPKMKARLAGLGLTGLAGTPADFRKLVTEDIVKWGKVVRFAGIKPD